MQIKQEEKPTGGRFVALENGVEIGQMEYEWDDKERFAITHTLVGNAYEGRGVARTLLDEAVAYARQNNKKIRAVCRYVVAQFARHSAYDDVNSSK